MALFWIFKVLIGIYSYSIKQYFQCSSLFRFSVDTPTVNRDVTLQCNLPQAASEEAITDVAFAKSRREFAYSSADKLIYVRKFSTSVSAWSLLHVLQGEPFWLSHLLRINVYYMQLVFVVFMKPIYICLHLLTKFMNFHYDYHYDKTAAAASTKLHVCRTRERSFARGLERGLQRVGLRQWWLYSPNLESPQTRLSGDQHHRHWHTGLQNLVRESCTFMQKWEWFSV